MKVGYYKDDLVEIEAYSINSAAEIYANEHHEIEEDCDMDFELYVEDNEGKLFLVDMFTEFNPMYYAGTCEVVK